LQLHVPDELQHGAPHVCAAGPENTGVEVDARTVDFLNEQLAAHDPRFRFFRWNVRNAMVCSCA